MELNLVIGGEAGQGLKTLNHILSKTLFRLGFNIYSTKNYMSRIRGGHNFMKIRISDEEVTSPIDKEDVLLALNDETIDLHKERLSDKGIVIFDGDADLTENELISLPAAEIAGNIGNNKVASTVFVGALLKVLGLKTDITSEILKDYFDKEKLVKANHDALEKGYNYVDKRFQLVSETKADKFDQILIDGNQAVACGAVTAGVQFYSAYPMTPATGIMNYIASKQDELGIVVEQAEDEIGAINMALGASYGGVRAMTGTSGGGFALMNEALSLAGITETPLVIAEVQRPGPATGLPTRTEQGDLSYVVNAGHGDFPLMVLAPRDAEDAFYQSFRAFNMAEKYQMPVIILSDQFLADSEKNIDEFDFTKLEYENSYISDHEKIDNYKRYKITEDGISPLAYPGQFDNEIVMVDSDEHSEEGYIIEDAETRIKMVDKRQKKIDKLVAEDLIEPEYIGPDNINYLLVGWGSTYGPLVEARKLLEAKGQKVGLLSFSDVWPLPTKMIEEIMEDDVQLISVENNSTGQFARLLRGETGIKADYKVLKYDGRPFTGEEIYEEIKDEVMV